MRTVLVIEDESQTRNIFLRCLEFEGFQAFGASDGITGMALANKHHPDLIVCDIMMPDVDGYSVLSALRCSQATASIPLIFLT
ncbi:MAG: response regulator, partial [Cyanobacteria bacterium J06639_14]